jgi:hypothetical protein
MLKTVELEIELFCRGMVIGDSCRTNDGRRISRTRAGLGSGLEIVIPARPKDIWVNVPVVEPFAQQSVFTLQKDDDGYFVADAWHESIDNLLDPATGLIDARDGALASRLRSRPAAMHSLVTLSGETPPSQPARRQRSVCFTSAKPSVPPRRRPSRPVHPARPVSSNTRQTPRRGRSRARRGGRRRSMPPRGCATFHRRAIGCAG